MRRMRKTVVGLLAHVDAGKTTLAEAMLYQAGKIRKYGRVDHGDTLLDTHGLEKARGITIFAGQAVFTAGDVEITLLDTPGHVDFSAETERMMQAMDYAILVISGAEGVQAHTKTLWRLIKAYNIPALIFVTKMDFARRTKESIMDELRQELGESCIDFTDYDNADTELTESLALCSERLLEKFLAGNKFDDSDIGDAVRMRGVFPSCLAPV